MYKAPQNQQAPPRALPQAPPIIVAANRTAAYLPLLRDKKIAIVGNQTSVIFKKENIESATRLQDSMQISLQPYTHLVDSLLKLQIQVEKVFAPEHGFRGKADAAELVADGKDPRTGLAVYSLYGKHKKPSADLLAGLDMLVIDIQDVGVRFYTYISTLHYVMQACAEHQIPVLILDRPNPNGHYVDGPILELQHQSFVGKHPVPLVHGMTLGEYAKMIAAEGWLGKDVSCDLTVIPMQGYTHQSAYELPIRPSPNLPNNTAIYLYPSLGLFEGTTINAGRGTANQFQVFGAPHFPKKLFSLEYTPVPNFGAKHPKHQGHLCFAKDLRNFPKPNKIHLEWLISAFQNTPKDIPFFKSKSFTIHAGTQKLRKQIESGKTAIQIREYWQKDLVAFKAIRQKYLIYP